MRPPAALALAAVAGLLAAPAAAELVVRITQPTAGRPVFGRVTIAAEVEASVPVARVVFFVDGSLVGQVERPPYRLTADIGQQNADHEFRVVAHAAGEERASAVVSTAAIAVDDAIDLELQQLYVTVTSGGRRMLHLAAGDFEILDNGVRQRLVTFERGEVPLTAVLLLDVSESMVGGRIEAAFGGARAFIGGMRELDEAKILLFSDELRRAVPFTSERAVLEAALTGLEAVGGTAINDFLYLALKLLDERQGRRAVVLFSDGADVHSVLPMEEVLAKARTSQALIYWIHLQGAEEGTAVPSFSSSWRDQEANRREFDLLRQAVEDSGGRAEMLASAAELDSAFREIMAELREQYVLGYYPSDSRDRGSWHEVKVRVSDPGLRVRTRDGYFDN